MKFVDNLKDYLAQKSIRKVLAFQNRHIYYPDFKSIKNILILFESDYNEKNKFIRSIVADLKAQGKKVTVWGYLDKKETSAAVLPEYRLFANKELTFYGIPNPQLIEEFLIGEYDMVIQLSVNDIYALDFLLAQAKAPFKVSKVKEQYKGISDFMIALDVPQESEIQEVDEDAPAVEPVDAKFLYEKIIFYLNSIQAKS